MAFIGLGIDMPTLQQPGPGIIPDVALHPEKPLPPRAPRSLGVRGGFVSSPSADLPPTMYTRDPMTNPLIPLPQSPLMEIPLVQYNPSLHLRAMKKRSIANRSFGLAGNGGLEPFHGLTGSPNLAETAESPSMMPSPTVPSSPISTNTDNGSFANHSLFVPSIALSVLLGILLLGVGGWTVVRYCRKRQESGEEPERRGVDSSPDLTDLETFAASSVVEKGLRPRTRTFSISSFSARPKSIMYQVGMVDGRRVSFFEDAHQFTHNIYSGPQSYHAEVRYSDTRSRARSSSLSVIERALTASRRTSTISLMSSLDPIEEEETLVSSSPSSHHRHVSAPVLDAHVKQSSRPASVASSTTTETGESVYTTASARSSISDLATLSTISCLSSFPETPKSKSHFNGTETTQDTPTKNACVKAGGGRKARARSQTVVSVKQIDLVRTAVGRTMSLQPSKQVVAALREMTEVENLNVLKDLMKGREALVFNIPPPPVPQMDEDDATSDPMTVEEIEKIVRPETGMRKAMLDLGNIATDISDPFALGDSRTGASVVRTHSFPSKLLARRKSNTAVKNPHLGARRSEVISDGYFKRALRALRGDEETMPPMPASGAFFDAQLDFEADNEAEDKKVNDQHHSSASTCSDDSLTCSVGDDERKRDSRPFSPVWADLNDVPEFDAYYLGLEGGFGLGTASDDEEETGQEAVAALAEAYLPHIKVTSH